MTADLGALRDAALRYAAAGWPVFPCKPGSKEPQPRHGFQDATTDPAKVRRWWQGPALFNVAIATGAPGPDVLDVDTHGVDGRQALRRLAEAGLTAGACALIRTRSGGLHLYYAGSGQHNGSLREHGVDFRSRGGYVLAPPSHVEPGFYEAIEKRPASGRLDWAAVKQLLDPSRQVTIPGARSPADARKLTSGAREGIARVVVEANQSGGWASALYWAGCRYGGRGAPLAEALDDLLPAAAPWNDHEARRAGMHIRNGWQRGSREAS